MLHKINVPHACGDEPEKRAGRQNDFNQTGEIEMINESVRAEVQMQFSEKSTGIWYSIQRQVKRAAIAQIMHECCNNQSAAAKALGINRFSLRSWIGQVFNESEMKDMGIES